MAISDVYNYGLLNRWPIRMTEDIYHFNQLAGTNAPLTRAGDYVYVQHERQMIADAINETMPLLVAYLGTYPRPEYVSEKINFRRGYSLALKYGYVEAIGRRATSAIQAGAAVVYAGHTATITVNTSITDITEIQVFFRVADGADSAASTLYRIEPVRVIVSGGVATITGHRALFCKPSNWQTEYTDPNYNESNKKVYDSADNSNYVTSVDVYRVYADSSSAVNLLYRNLTVSQTAYQSVTGAALIEDSHIGTVGVTESTGAACTYDYEKVEIFYRAGIPLDSTGEYNRPLRDAAIMLANCALGQVLNPLDPQRLNVLQRDQVIRTVNDTPIDDKTPFGQAYGQVRAWNTVRSIALGQGGALV